MRPETEPPIEKVGLLAQSTATLATLAEPVPEPPVTVQVFPAGNPVTVTV